LLIFFFYYHKVTVKRIFWNV